MTASERVLPVQVVCLPVVEASSGVAVEACEESTCAAGTSRATATLTDSQIAAYLMDCEVSDLPHQLVAAHEAELALLSGAFDDGLFDVGGEG